jgi:hypothetical protein
LFPGLTATYTDALVGDTFHTEPTVSVFVSGTATISRIWPMPTPSTIATYPPTKDASNMPASTSVVGLPLSAVPSLSPRKSMTEREPPLPFRAWDRQNERKTSAAKAPPRRISMRRLKGAGVPSSS